MTQEEMLLEAAQTGLAHQFYKIKLDCWKTTWMLMWLYCRDHELEELGTGLSKGRRS